MVTKYIFTHANKIICRVYIMSYSLNVTFIEEYT